MLQLSSCEGTLHSRGLMILTITWWCKPIEFSFYFFFNEETTTMWTNPFQKYNLIDGKKILDDQKQ
jgi:hypothetical protein